MAQRCRPTAERPAENSASRGTEGRRERAEGVHGGTRLRLQDCRSTDTDRCLGLGSGHDWTARTTEAPLTRATGTKRPLVSWHWARPFVGTVTLSGLGPSPEIFSSLLAAHLYPYEQNHAPKPKLKVTTSKAIYEETTRLPPRATQATTTFAASQFY